MASKVFLQAQNEYTHKQNIKSPITGTNRNKNYLKKEITGNHKSIQEHS